MIEKPDDQTFPLRAESRMLWYFVLDGTVYGPFPSQVSAYSELKTAARSAYAPKEQAAEPQEGKNVKTNNTTGELDRAETITVDSVQPIYRESGDDNRQSSSLDVSPVSSLFHALRSRWTSS